MGAALAPAALAPPIANTLNLSKDATEAALTLLATGAQPSFVARYRREQIGGLHLRDLERIQARAAAAAAFEMRRHQLLAELSQPEGARADALRAATELVDLEDVRAAGKRRKKGAASQARRQGLSGLASLLWHIGTPRAVVDADGAAAPPAGKRKRRRRGKGGEQAAAETEAQETGVAADAGATPSAESDGAVEATADSAASADAASADAVAATDGAASEAVQSAAADAEAPDATSSDVDGGDEPAEVVEPPQPVAIDVESNADPAVIAEAYVNAGIDATAKQALAGARAICLDDIVSDPEVRLRLRALLVDEGSLAVSEGPGRKKPKAAKPSPKATPAPAKADAAASSEAPATDVAVQTPEAVPAAETAAVETPAAPAPAVEPLSADAPVVETPAAEAPAPEADAAPTEVAASADATPTADALEAVQTPAPTQPEAQTEAVQAQPVEPTAAQDGSTTVDVAPAKAPKQKKVREKKDSKKDKPNRYARFIGKSDLCSNVGSNTLLTLHRGERDGSLLIDMTIDEARVVAVMSEVLQLRGGNPSAQLLVELCRQAWNGPLGKAIKNGARRLLKQRIDRFAIGEYCEALRPLLMAPRIGARPVMGIEPGQAPGCRIAIIDESGRLIASDHVYPLQPKLQAPQAKARIAEMCAQHSVAAIAISNSGGGREVERLCREAVREVEALHEVIVTSVDSDAAGQYASSHIAKEELPGTDTAVRRACSAARRVQDPLVELTKLDARKLSLGQYQHEVDQEELRAALAQVETSCINEISVDLNTASADRLARVAGLSQALAKSIVAHRDRTGPFRTRAQLLEVDGMSAPAFQQAAGFVRIAEGENPLDRTTIHPERYGQVTEMAADLGVTVGDLIGNAELVGKLDPSKYIGKAAMGGIPLGKPTLDALLQQLRTPGVDPRPPLVSIEYDPALTSFADLEVGMELPGVVTHVAGFGAFIDVGLAYEGLVHVSELSHGFIETPSEAVHVGQQVRGKVIDIEPKRKRFGMSLRALLPKPERPEGERRNRGPGRGQERQDRGGGKGKGGDRRGNRDRDRRDDRGRGRGPNKGGKGPRRDQKEDRVLGFNMDLSAFAERLKNG